MKTISNFFKKIAILFFYLLLLNDLPAQIISTVGGGLGFFGAEPARVSIPTTRDCIVQSSFSCTNGSFPVGTLITDIPVTRDIPNQSFIVQFANLSYEPRWFIADSIGNSLGLSLGMPLNFSFMQHTRDEYSYLEYYEEFDMTFQGALIAYLNFGNGSSYEDLYSNKYGFSIGGGLMYSHLGVFKNELNDIDPPPNNLIQPVLSLSFRYMSPLIVISEFNILMRPKRSHVFGSQYLNECCRTSVRNIVKNEFGILIQYKLLFG